MDELLRDKLEALCIWAESEQDITETSTAFVSVSDIRSVFNT